MPLELLLLLSLAVFTVAFLYSSVGHAGASGYIAVLSLFGVSVAMLKPSALVLNILVACLSSWQFYRAGYFSWRIFLPFAIASVPFAFLGGYVSVPTYILKIILGAILLYSAIRFVLQQKEEEDTHLPPTPLAIMIGAVLGFVSGLTGVGGGIFLTPLLIFMKWARTKTASAVSALFILVNSVAGLFGAYSSAQHLPTFIIPISCAAIIGGAIGSYYGSRKFSPLVIKRILAVVLLIAGVKLIFV